MTNQEYIDKLHPAVRTAALQAVAEANARLTGRAQFKIAFGYRTFEEQQEIYNQGRNGHPGMIVTNAKPGQSYHNYALALDGALLIDGKSLSWDTGKDWDGDRQSDWMEVVAAFKKFGWAWGGDWRTFKDMPHFEMTFGHNWRQLITFPKDKDGYVILK